MPKDKLTDYSATNASNTDVGGVNIDEGMLPSAVNNSIRELMTHLKEFSDGTNGIDVLALEDDDASAAIKFQAPSAVTSDTTFTLPDGDGDSGQTLITNGSGTLAWAAPYGNRNLIINGACNVQQRGTQTGQGGGANAYTAVDRYQLVLSGAKTPRVTSSQQSTTTGEFANQLKLDCTTSQSSVAAADLFAVRQRIEGQNLQHLQYGTASAKTLTASFTITSPKSGTHCVQLHHRDASYSYVREFTVDAANTAQRISVTFPGYTTTALDDDNASSLELAWPLLAGSNWQTTKDGWNSGNYFATSNQQNLLDNTANDFLITGVQLEVGETATPFEHRSFGDELERCRRYTVVLLGDQNYSQIGGTGIGLGSTNIDVPITLNPKMRATPALTNSGSLQGSNASSGFILSSISLITQQSSSDVASVRGVTSGLTAGNPYRLESANNTTARVILSAEL